MASLLRGGRQSIVKTCVQKMLRSEALEHRPPTSLKHFVEEQKKLLDDLTQLSQQLLHWQEQITRLTEAYVKEFVNESSEQINIH